MFRVCGLGDRALGGGGGFLNCVSCNCAGCERGFRLSADGFLKREQSPL